MLRIIREGQRWLTALFIIGVGGVFVFFLGLGGAQQSSDQIGSVGNVGPIRIDGRAFERARERREDFLESQLGDQYDGRRMADTLDGMALQEMVNEALLVLSARDLGMTVSKSEIEKVVIEGGGFRDEGGRFDADFFRDTVQYEFGSEANFMETQRNQLLSLKMLRLLNQQPHVSDAEVRSVLERELEQVKLAFVTIDIEVDEDAPIDPARLEEALTSRASELETLFDAQRNRFEIAEQVHTRHILLRLAKSASEEEVTAANTRAAGILARLHAGEDFAAVARETTEDDASRDSGGDLGFFGRGQMVTEFEEAAFAAQTGELSGAIRSDFGLHIIRVEEHKDAVNKTLDDVREELARELTQGDVAREKARVKAEALANAVRGGASLEEAARTQDVALSRTDWVSRRLDGFIPGLGAAQDLLATAFSVEPGTSSPRIFEVGAKLALVQVLERKDADPATVDARFEASREQLLNERRNARADDWISAKRDELLDRGELDVDLERYRGR